MDPDPEWKFRIQQKVKEHINKNVNSSLFVLFDSTVVLNREWQIVVRILPFDWIYWVFLFISDYTYLINIGWIRIRTDQELLPGSGSGTSVRGNYWWKDQLELKIRGQYRYCSIDSSADSTVPLEHFRGMLRLLDCLSHQYGTVLLISEV